MSSISVCLIAVFCVMLSCDLTSCQYNPGGQQTSYSQSTTYQQQPYGGQQTVVVQETVNKPGMSQTTVTKTVSNPSQPVGTSNYQTTNYAQKYGNGYNNGG